MSKKALITGGAGFIGSNLVFKLNEMGWKIVILDNLSRKGSSENLRWLLETGRSKNLKFIEGDIRDLKTVKKAVLGTDVIFHLAAQVAVTTSVTDPREDFEINALGSFNVLEAARNFKPKPVVVFASTNKVYGEMVGAVIASRKNYYYFKNYKRGITENFNLDLHSPYGCSKGAADQYVRDFWRIYGLPTVVFRQSCIYGPRQMGVEDQGWVAHFAIAALFGRPITIYGDGRQVRDILFVHDLVDAYLVAVERIDRVAGQIFNIGGGYENAVSLNQYVGFLKKSVGLKVVVGYDNWRPGDQKVFISNNKKAEKMLDWKPKVGWEQGVGKMIGWINENRKLFI